MKERVIGIIQKNRRLLTFVLLTAMGVVYYLPALLKKGILTFPYADTIFHLSRVIGMRNVWTSPVSFLNFGHYGGMINVFYPWLTLYPMFLLYRITGSYVLAYKTFCLLLTVLTLFLSMSVMYRISADRFGAVIFAVLYTYSLYRFDNIFHREAAGEFIAITFLPVVLLGLYYVFFDDFSRWKFLAAGMTLLAYTHNLTLFLSAVVTGLLFILSFPFGDHKKERFAALVKAALTALVLSLASLLPMLEIVRTNILNIPGGSGKLLGASAFDLKTIVIDAFSNRPASRGIGLLGILAILVLSLYYLTCLFSKKKPDGSKAVHCFFASGVILFFAVTSLLPWERIGDATFLSGIQFIWRLNAWVTILPFAVLAFYLPRWFRSLPVRLIVLGVTCCAAVLLHYGAFMTLRGLDSSYLRDADFANGDAVSYDYSPLLSKQHRDNTGEEIIGVLVDGETVPAEISISADGSIYTAEVTAPSSTGAMVRADLPVFRYHQQDCTVNGEPAETALTERGGTGVWIPSGRSSVITVSYGYTKPAWLSRALSCAALVLFVFSCAKKNRGKQG